MGKLKLSSNLFLEVAELQRYRQFIEDYGYKMFVKYLTKSFGIAQNSDNTLFKVSQKAGSTNTVTINAGVAFDNNLNIIILKEDTDIEIELDGQKKWIIISYASTNNEDGTVSISNQGVMSGSGTKFTEILRGQPNFPTKVRFNSTKNNIDYEVVEVNSDTEAVLSGSFTAESGLKYQVVGTFTPGFQPDDDDKEIYEYDSCNIEVVDSEDKPTLTDGQYILASIDFSSNVMSIIDERSSYMFNQNIAYNDDINIKENAFVALRSTKLKNERMLDVQFEWGYKVQRFEMLNTSLNNIFNIVVGESKYIPMGDNIPDNIFAGWLLVNRKNMLSVTIDRNENNYLYISKFNSSLITNTDDDFVIVPPYSEIEIEANLSGTNYDEDDTDYFFEFSIENLKTHFILPLEYLDTLISLRYRMKSYSGETTEFQKFAITQFKNTDGNNETLGNSSFEVYVSEPEVKVRNYS